MNARQSVAESRPAQGVGESEAELGRKKRKTEPIPSARLQGVEATPRNKVTQPANFWDKTASAVKEQQKNLRAQNKKLDAAAEGTVGVSKKKKSEVNKIFLSDEQQNVLDLVTEHKKNVFFTGSAGKHS